MTSDVLYEHMVYYAIFVRYYWGQCECLDLMIVKHLVFNQHRGGFQSFPFVGGSDRLSWPGECTIIPVDINPYIFLECGTSIMQ